MNETLEAQSGLPDMREVTYRGRVPAGKWAVVGTNALNERWVIVTRDTAQEAEKELARIRRLYVGWRNLGISVHSSAVESGEGQ